MKYTEVYGLKKPESADFYNVEDFNENTDKIEHTLKSHEASIVPLTSAIRVTRANGVPDVISTADFLLLTDDTADVSAGNLQCITTTMQSVLTEGDVQRVTGVKIGKGINRVRVDFSSAFDVSGKTDLYVRVERLRGRAFSPVFYTVNTVDNSIVTVTGSTLVEVQENDFIFLKGDMTNSSDSATVNALYAGAVTSLCVQAIG